MKKKLDIFNQHNYVNWERENPRPVSPKLTNTSWQRHNMTQVMLQEIAIIEERNKELSKNYMTDYQHWLDKRKIYCDSWAKNNLTQKEFEIYLTHDENHWYLEEVLIL